MTPINDHRHTVKRIRASVVCVNDDRVLLVKLRDPTTNVLRLFPPGGKVEIGESPADAAIRECYEETHCKIKLSASKHIEDEYRFNWDQVEYECHTTYFLAELIECDPTPVHDAEYNEGVAWVSLDQISEKLAFNSSICNAVKKLLPEN